MIYLYHVGRGRGRMRLPAWIKCAFGLCLKWRHTVLTVFLDLLSMGILNAYCFPCVFLVQLCLWFKKFWFLKFCGLIAWAPRFAGVFSLSVQNHLRAQLNLQIVRTLYFSFKYLFFYFIYFQVLTAVVLVFFLTSTDQHIISYEW